jgi:hypothetical protein
MRERLVIHPENNHELEPVVEHHKPRHEQAEVKHHKPEKDPTQAAAEARTAAKHEHATDAPNPLERLKATDNESLQVNPRLVSSELQKISLRTQLTRVRRSLSSPERLLSQVVHQPAVRVVSEAAGKTISRPSGLLGGGLVALLGTSTYLYLAKHLGFEYNYGVFLILFAGGFVLGLILELVVHYATASRRKG